MAAAPQYQNQNFIISGSSTWSGIDTSITDAGFGCDECATDAELCEYLDGQVYSYCTNCGRRIAIERVPGGFNLLNLKDFISTLASEEDISEEDVDLLSTFRRQLTAEREALDEAEGLLATATQMVMRKADFDTDLP